MILGKGTPTKLVALLRTVLALAVSLPGGVAAQGQASLPTPAEAPRARLVPVGTLIPLEIKNTINSHTAYVGEAIYCETLYPVSVNDRILIPAHSFVKAAVADVVRPGKVRGKAQLSLRIDSITLPDGITRTLQATVYSIAGARLSSAKGEEEVTEPAEGGDLAVSGGQDAVVDATGLGGASPISAVSEGVGGLVVMLATRGKTIILRPGTTLEIQLNAPLSLSRSGGKSVSAQTPALSHRPPSDTVHASNPKPPK